MFKKLFYIFFFLISSLSFAQTTYFTSIGGGFSLGAVYLSADSINNKLYAYGSFPKIKNTNLQVNGAAVWDGTKWDSIRHVVGDSIGRVINVNNVMYGIGYQLVRENPSTHIWEEVARPNINSSGSFNQLGKYGNDLIIFGSQDSINGLPVSQIVKYDGVNFTSIQNNLQIYSNISLCEYNGELYAGGTFYIPGEGACHLVKWSGTTWSSAPIGTYANCSFCGVGKMIVYQNKLFIGGRFSQMSQQSSYTNLLSWDGSNLVDYNLLGSSVESVWDMCIYKNKLIITGLMDATIPISNQHFTGFLSYDGNDMCSYAPYYGLSTSGANSYKLNDVEIFQDTLVFLSTRKMSPTDTVNWITKYVGDFIPLFCSTGVGVKENYISDEAIKIYPNPTNSILNIVDENNQLQNAIIEIKNYLGQSILSVPFQQEINVSGLSSGMYFLRIKTEDNQLMNAKFIKQ